ncbi:MULTISPECIES: DUF397 domain-containing protein [Streptomyces]|uniref:DUF397 domain-containing protein n=1 Tax=Streptomyces TaxID=1883 RepID=UPI0013D9DA67|nr:DUF397 domain-containing protein [Streptomyces aureoverticillatus]QIB43895.1 DUF397 domain-containing protein [Streptomyces aureoverticillatus]
MTELQWQKSTYSAQGANCVNVAASPDGTIHLRESDAPDVTLTTGPRQLQALITALRRTS